MTPKAFVFLTRPWEVHFHIALAEKLKARFPKSTITFATFYIDATKIARQSGYSCLYFPEELKNVSAIDLASERLEELDQYAGSYWKNLTEMLFCERFLPRGAKEKDEFLKKHMIVLDDLIGPETISISSMFDHFVYVATGMLSFMKGGAHFAFVGCGIPGGRVLALKTPSESWQNQKRIEEPESFIQKAHSDLDIPPEIRIDYMRKCTYTKERPVAKRLSRVMHLKRCAKKDYRNGSYFPTCMRWWPANQIWGNAVVKFKQLSDPDWDIETAKDLELIQAPFVYIALHMEPEATVNMYSIYYRDQLKMISDVLWSLPVHWHVVVKENPKMKYKRNRRFYKTIKDIPRTHLASPDLSSTAILKKSSAVVSVGGTVTVEAALLGKPAFCSGTPPFHFFAKSTGPDIYPSLNKIVSILKDSPSRDEERLSKNMKRHLQSTFVAKYALEDFRDDVQHMTVDSSQENAEAYASYILECISD